MIFTCLDFETKDPYINLELGAGWPFAVNYPHASLFYPIGYSYCFIDTELGTISRSTYLPLHTKGLVHLLEPDNEGLAKLRDLIANTKNIVCHNAQYDLGCLLSIGISIDHLRTYDTKVMAQLYDSTLWSYSLSSLAKKYGVGEKQQGSLGDIVAKFDLLKTPGGNTPNHETKTYKDRAIKYAYANMDILQELDPAGMAYYANGDTIVTALLFKLFYPKIGDKLSHFYSNIQKICVKMRARGVCVDMENVDKAIEILSPTNETLERELYKHLGDINLHSNDQLPAKLVELGYKLPYTDAGNPSLNKEFMEEFIAENPQDTVIQTIGNWRTVNMLLNTFSIKVKEMQRYSCPDLIATGGRYGKVFPELNLLEARTGRFSSSNPNIQNVPKRNKEFAKLCRAMFTTHDRNASWFSLDWSNQEGRLQLHYAVLNNFRKAKEWQARFLKDPKIDVHSLVATMMGGVERDIAKTIYLGKSFCMGRGKTAKRLGLPTAMVDYGHGPTLSSGPEATKLIEKYDAAFPYLTDLQKDCMKVIIDKGYIKTLGGRKCKRPPRVRGRSFDYKAISLLIQGGAADQMYTAMTEADNAGLLINCIVHDEFNIEGTIEDARKMQQIMETCVDLKVPSVAEVKVGTNWGNLEKLDDKAKTN